MGAEGCGGPESAGGGLSGRKVNTTAPLTGGGSLAADLTLAIPASTDSVDGYLTAVDHAKVTAAVPGTRTLATTAPLAGGGDLSANRTLSMPAATDSVDGYLTAVDHAKITAAVPTTRTLTTTAPLAGGGDLSANRTLSLTTGQGLLILSGTLHAGALRAYWEAFAAGKFGCLPNQLATYIQDFDGEAGGRNNVGGTTVVNTAPALDGGWVSITAGSGGLAAGNYGILAPALPTGSAPTHLASPKTSKWMMILRGKLTTAPAAHTVWSIGTLTAGFTCGINAATNAGFFTAVFGATTIVSTIAIDTNTHTIYVWNDGTNVHLSVDGEAEVSAASTNLPTLASEVQQNLVTTAGDALATENVDYFGILVQRS